VKLTLVDEMHYPPPPVQRPRIPLWAVGVWPRNKSMARILKCDGLLPAKIDPDGKLIEVKPADLCEMKAYVDANRTLTTPFDFVIEGKTVGLSPAQAQDKLQPGSPPRHLVDRGPVEMSQEEVVARIKQGPPQLR